MGFYPALVDAVRDARQALHIVAGSPAAATRLLERAATPATWAEVDAAGLDAVVAHKEGEEFPVPRMVPGADDEERRRNWSRLIGRRIEEAAPAATFAAKTLRSQQNLVATFELRNLFENNGAVDLRAIEDVRTFLREQAVLDDEVDRETLEAQVISLRRLLAPSPRFDTALALCQEGWTLWRGARARRGRESTPQRPDRGRARAEPRNTTARSRCASTPTDTSRSRARSSQTSDTPRARCAPGRRGERR